MQEFLSNSQFHFFSFVLFLGFAYRYPEDAYCHLILCNQSLQYEVTDATDVSKGLNVCDKMTRYLILPKMKAPVSSQMSDERVLDFSFGSNVLSSFIILKSTLG